MRLKHLMQLSYGIAAFQQQSLNIQPPNGNVVEITGVDIFLNMPESASVIDYGAIAITANLSQLQTLNLPDIAIDRGIIAFSPLASSFDTSGTSTIASNLPLIINDEPFAIDPHVIAGANFISAANGVKMDILLIIDYEFKKITSKIAVDLASK